MGDRDFVSASVSIDLLLVLVELSHLFSTVLKLAAILDINFDTTFTDAVGLDLFGKNCSIVAWVLVPCGFPESLI